MRRILNPALMLLNFVFLMVVLSLILTRVTHAQPHPSEATQRAYVLDHPIDPDMLILATSDGRYSIVRLSECSWLHGDLDIVMWEGQSAIRTVEQFRDGDGTQCLVGVTSMVDSTPCFANEFGNCDVDSGEHYW